MLTNINKKRIIFIAGSVLIALIFCIPFLNGHINVGPDTTFHMNRIESIKISIENGVLYPYIYTEQNYGFGYGTAAFYGQLFLYPAVLLRLLGFGIASTWRIYIFLIIFCISISACYSTKKITNISNPWLILLSATLCVLNTFLITRAHQRAAVGEMLSLIFIPLIINETHELIYKKRNNWLKLGLLFFCLLMSHNISFILTVLVFGVTVICNIKTVINNKSYLTLLKAAIFAILLSSFFLFPLLEQLSSNLYNINNSINQTTELYGMTLIDYFDFNTNILGSIKPAINASLFLLPFLSFLTKRKDLYYIFITGCILLFLSSEFFPWKFIGFLNFIQFPTRFITIALPYLSISSVITVYEFYNRKNSVVNVMIALCLLESLYACIVTIHDIYKQYGTINNSTTSSQIRTGIGIYGNKDINFFYNIPETSGNEYFPKGFYGDYYSKSLVPQIESSDQKVDILYKNFNEQNYKLTIKNDTTFIFPKIYYKGYVVSIYKDGNYVETLVTQPDKKNQSFVSVTLDDKYRGQEIQLQLVYKNTKIQKISIAISLITLISTIGYLIYKKKKSI